MLGAVLASRGRPRAGLWAMVTGALANVLSAAVFGVACIRRFGADEFGLVMRSNRHQPEGAS